MNQEPEEITTTSSALHPHFLHLKLKKLLLCEKDMAIGQNKNPNGDRNIFPFAKAGVFLGPRYFWPKRPLCIRWAPNACRERMFTSQSAEEAVWSKNSRNYYTKT